MKLVVKDVDIATGGVQVVILNQKDASLLDLHHSDRLSLKKGRHRTIAVLDIAESEKAVPRGKIGCMEEVLDALKARGGDEIEIAVEQKPESVDHIKKKLDGRDLNSEEVHHIIKDIVDNKLTTIEVASYVTANYTKGMSMHEIVSLTRAMRDTGDVLKLPYRKIIDLHCIGGVPGNRTTMIVVPILVAAGLKVPKTSSRAITSPAGTADTMEVLAPVTLPVPKLRKMLDSIGGFIVWGGAINLAPADDKIIAVEHPLSIDAEGQMLASIMAKKASVSATHLLLDLPIGPGSKIANEKQALYLAKRFSSLGKHLHINVATMISDGSEPIGNGIGPALEARDCLWVLDNDRRAPEDLRQKSIDMAAAILEMAGKSKKGHDLAIKILENGSALEAMNSIIKAQGGRPRIPARIQVGKHTHELLAGRSGTIQAIDNLAITKIARLAGAPLEAGSGLYLHKHVGDRVQKGEPLLTIHAHNENQLSYAKEAAKNSIVVR